MNKSPGSYGGFHVVALSGHELRNTLLLGKGLRSIGFSYIHPHLALSNGPSRIIKLRLRKDFLMKLMYVSYQKGNFI